MRKNYMILSMYAIIALVLAACGSGEASTSLQVDMIEFAYEPRDFTVPAGEEITVELANNGAVEHEFVIMKYGTEVGQDFGQEDQSNIYWEAELGPGQSGTFTFTAPQQPGEYQIVCGTEGHYAAGMIGRLFVVAPE